MKTAYIKVALERLYKTGYMKTGYIKTGYMKATYI